MVGAQGVAVSPNRSRLLRGGRERRDCERQEQVHRGQETQTGAGVGTGGTQYQ